MDREASVCRRVGKALEKGCGDGCGLIDEIGYGFFTTDNKGTITFVNRTLAELLGHEDPEEVMGRHFLQYLPAEVQDEVMQKFIRATKDKTYSETLEFPTAITGGNTGFVQLRHCPVMEDGRITGTRGIIRDISGHKRTEQELRETHERLRALLNATTESALLIDPQGIILVLNQTAAQRLGFRPQDITGTCIYDVLPPDVANFRKARVDQVVQSGRAIRFEDVREGEIYDNNFYPVFDVEGRVTAVAVFARCITVRKRAEDALRESEGRYRSLFEDSHSVMLLIDPDNGDIVDANPAACSFYGLAKEELTRKKITDINMLPGELVLKELKQVTLEPRTHFYFPHRLANGAVRNVEVFTGPIRLNGRELVYSMVYDVTERVRAEKALKKRERELEIKSENLEEANTAMKVLLKKREEDKKELEEKVLLNVRQLVMPYLAKLKRSGLDDRQKAYADILESHLDDVISPLLRTLSVRHANLTPTEIQVASHVKQGKRTKEIADLLNLSSRTICFHRENIRRKIGLRKRGANLRTHLLSLP